MCLFFTLWRMNTYQSINQFKVNSPPEKPQLFRKKWKSSEKPNPLPSQKNCPPLRSVKASQMFAPGKCKHPPTPPL